jgi:hypothetical protein
VGHGGSSRSGDGGEGGDGGGVSRRWGEGGVRAVVVVRRMGLFFFFFFFFFECEREREREREMGEEGSVFFLGLMFSLGVDPDGKWNGMGWDDGIWKWKWNGMMGYDGI